MGVLRERRAARSAKPAAEPAESTEPATTAATAAKSAEPVLIGSNARLSATVACCAPHLGIRSDAAASTASTPPLAMGFATIRFHPGPRVASIVLNRPPLNVINL